MVALKYTVAVNGISEIALTKLDVLDEFPEVKACYAYKLNGKVTDVFPADIASRDEITPLFETFKGWKSSLAGVKSFADLPKETKVYFDYIEDFVGAEIKIVSLSPDRNDTLIKE